MLLSMKLHYGVEFIDIPIKVMGAVRVIGYEVGYVNFLIA
jgi:hypothetical protein